jgi:general secretion pathway protein F
MAYFNVTGMEKGKRREELIQAKDKMDAIKTIKSNSPNIMVMKAVEGSAPVGEIFSNFLEGIQKSFKGKIPVPDKISTIRQIAVMTDAGIAINDTLEDVAENTENPQLKMIYSKMNADINAGNTMTDALEPYAEEFGRVALAMNCVYFIKLLHYR